MEQDGWETSQLQSLGKKRVTALLRVAATLPADAMYKDGSWPLVSDFRSFKLPESWIFM